MYNQFIRFNVMLVACGPEIHLVYLFVLRAHFTLSLDGICMDGECDEFAQREPRF